MNSSPSIIPGVLHLTAGGSIPNGALLLLGAPGSGKSMYCRQFLLDGVQAGDRCLLISSLDRTQVQELFSTSSGKLDKLEVIHILPEEFTSREALQRLAQQIEDTLSRGPTPIRAVFDSLSSVVLFSGHEASLSFVSRLIKYLRNIGAMSIFTMLAPRSNDHFSAHLESMFDGIVELKIEEPSMTRRIRLYSIRGMRHDPYWIPYAISKNGTLFFGNQVSNIDLVCSLCGKPISGTPITASETDNVFDSQKCLDTYRKLAGVYGSTIIAADSMRYEVVNVNLFFVDIVGLSDPSLSVKRQVEKISVLTKSIAACDAFKNSKKDKVVLPTGDGMAICFLHNPELPLQLAVELDSKLQEYNRNRTSEDEIGVRIGLGSGPVFIVNDINNNQNVWGPGIILARRVMDIGDNRHILLSGSLAEQLLTLKDQYRETIKLIGDFQIKHGQTIRVYSAYSANFGNAERPKRMPIGSSEK